LLLDVLVYLPFLAVSFAFFGLTLAGVYTYIKYYNQKPGTEVVIQTRLLIFTGIHIIVSIIILYLYNQYALNFIESVAWKIRYEDTSNYVRLHIFLCSSLAGFLFSFSFFQLGVIVCALYKANSDQCQKFYWFDLCGAASGCVFTVIILNFLQVSSILLLLSFTAFALAWFLEKKAAHRQIPNKVLSFMLLCSASLLFVNTKYNILEIKLNPPLMTGKRDSQELWSRWNIYSRTALLKSRNSTSAPVQLSVYS
jgi:hypothetical protein